MASIRMTLGAGIDRQDLIQLQNNLKDVGPEDEIIVTMQAADAHQADIITAELERQGFDYQPHGGDGRDFYLIAHRRKK